MVAKVFVLFYVLFPDKKTDLSFVFLRQQNQAALD